MSFILILWSCRIKNEIDIKEATQIVLTSSNYPSGSITYVYADIDESRKFIYQVVDIENYKDTTCYYLFISNVDTTFVGSNLDSDSLFWFPYTLNNKYDDIWYNVEWEDRGISLLRGYGFTKRIEPDKNSFIGNLYLFPFEFDTIKWKLDNDQRICEVTLLSSVFTKQSENIISYPTEFFKPIKNSVDVFTNHQRKKLL